MPNRFFRRRWDDTGPVNRYDTGHDHDRFGALGDASLYGSGADWSRFEITGAEFERAWSPSGA